MQSMMINFRNYLVKSIPSMVIKYSSIAKSYETIETKKASDVYIAAMLKIDSFLTYSNYTFDVLKKAGFTDIEATQYSQLPSTIPANKRDAAMLAARDDVLATYVEGNNYYRMLNGMPDVDDIEELWLDPEVYTRHKLEPQPLLELPSATLIYLESIGEISVLKDRYPDKKYLDHIGARKIDIVQARMADNYELLYLPRYNDAASFYRDFCNYYEECREYFMTVIYNQYYVSKYEGYDNYIAFMILTMTINTLVSGVFKSFVFRDFYDVDTIRIFLNSYGIEYDGRFNMSQLKVLTKNLNILLQKKGTDQVLLDIMDLLGYSNFHLMKYYLVKQHKVDSAGKPIFVYNTATDEDGNEQQVLDKSQMYDVYFTRAKVGTYNPQEALHNTSKVFKYGDITTLDRYWVEDETLIDKMINSQFNCIDTKYMDIEVIYRMHQIVFETTYISRMILDKPETKQIVIELPNLSSTPVSLFDIITTLICLLCKYYRIKPTLLKSPSKILHVMGFNFKADFDKLKEELKKYPSINPNLLKYINDTIFTSPSDVNDMYVHIKNLDVTLVDLMNKTTDIKTYRVLEKLYNTLMWTELTNETFADANGDIPDYFTEYLQTSSPEIAGVIENITPEEASEMIDYITTKLSNTFYDTEFLTYLKIFDTHTFAAILKLLRFFKSYTVDLRDVNMVLMLDSKYYNMIHFTNSLSFDDVNMFIPDYNFLNNALDIINSCKTKVRNREKIFTREEMEFLAYIFKSSYMYTQDKVLKMYTEGYDSLMLHMSQMLNVVDMLKANGLISMQDIAELHEYVYSIKTLYMNYVITLKENVKFKSMYPLSFRLTMADKTKMDLTMKHIEVIDILTHIQMWALESINNYIKFDETPSMDIKITPKLIPTNSVDIMDAFLEEGLTEDTINLIQNVMILNQLSNKDKSSTLETLSGFGGTSLQKSSIETLDLLNRIIPEMIYPEYMESRIRQLYQSGIYQQDSFNLKDSVTSVLSKILYKSCGETITKIDNMINNVHTMDYISNKDTIIQELYLYKDECVEYIDYIQSIKNQLIRDEIPNKDKFNIYTKQLMSSLAIQHRCYMIYLVTVKLKSYASQFDAIHRISVSIGQDDDNNTASDKMKYYKLNATADLSNITDLCKLMTSGNTMISDVKFSESGNLFKFIGDFISKTNLSDDSGIYKINKLSDDVKKDDAILYCGNALFPIYNITSCEKPLCYNGINVRYRISKLDDALMNPELTEKEYISSKDSCVFIWQD